MNFKIKPALSSLIGALVVAILLQGALGVRQLRTLNDSAIALSADWLPSVRELG